MMMMMMMMMMMTNAFYLIVTELFNEKYMLKFPNFSRQ